MVSGKLKLVQKKKTVAPAFNNEGLRLQVETYRAQTVTYCFWRGIKRVPWSTQTIISEDPIIQARSSDTMPPKAARKSKLSFTT